VRKVIDKYGVAYMIGSRYVGVAAMAGLYVALTSGLDVSAMIEAQGWKSAGIVSLPRPLLLQQCLSSSLLFWQGMSLVTGPRHSCCQVLCFLLACTVSLLLPPLCRDGNLFFPSISNLVSPGYVREVCVCV
jgi:hypothetical protein